MNIAEAVFSDGSEMKLCAIPFMEMETIVRIFLVVAHHEAVALNFGNDGSCRARKHFFICFHDCFLRNGDINAHIPVYNQKISDIVFSAIAGIAILIMLYKFFL